MELNEAVGYVNTDKEIWRKVKGDYYAPSIHVTKEGSIGIDVGGKVVVLPVEEWHKLALISHAQRKEELSKALNCRLFQLIPYLFPRAVGHTFTELNGVNSVAKAVLIVANEQQARDLKLPLHKYVTLSSLPDSLRGRACPVIIDHMALNVLISEVSAAIHGLLKGER